MPEPAATASLHLACQAAIEAWQGALLGPADSLDDEVRGMSDAGLVRTIDAVAALARRVEGLLARCAGELADRSCGQVDADVAREHGFANAERLIASATGRRRSDAARLISTGRAISTRQSFYGEPLPPQRPHLAAAVTAGALCIDAADLIRRFCDRIAFRADADELNAAEALLVDRAPVVGVDGLPRLITHLEAHLDPDGVQPREDALRAARSLRIWQDRHGMIKLQGAFDPASGAFVKAAVESLVTAELRASRGFNHGAHPTTDASAAADGTDTVDPSDALDRTAHHVADGRDEPGQSHAPDTRGGANASPDPLFAEDRTLAQMNADALTDLARHALGCTDAPTALRNVTVVARVDADALESGIGHATIDGIEHPVSILTARELALSVGVAPLLLGTDCAALDLGRAARIFTREQKIALLERDGGCAWPGCDRPPAYSEAHHISWWKRDHGTTDLDNGIMLCSHHHHRVHRDGWLVFIRDGRSWFVPPAHLDPAQTARAGNLATDHLIRQHLAKRRRRAIGSSPSPSASPSPSPSGSALPGNS
ncbi:DUF222 domain-containing protein [Agromyces soli]